MRSVLFTIVLLAFAIVFATASRPTAAQTPAAPKCDLTSVIKAANALKASGDNKTDLAALLKLRDSISQANIACNGLTITGKGVKVVPPFVLPKAFYKVTATSNGYLIVDARSMEGSDCKAGVEDNLFILDDQQAKLGAETTLDIQFDCRIMLSVSNTRTDWKITFEPMQ